MTLNSKSQLDQLTAQYKALPKDCQAYVTNYDTLKAGNASYEKLKKQYDAGQKAAAEKAAAQKAQQSKKNSSSGWEKLLRQRQDLFRWRNRLLDAWRLGVPQAHQLPVFGSFQDHLFRFCGRVWEIPWLQELL